ncbi:protein of unknown function [Latilactobacillus sakei]|nr:protein of unknown function [Latilactobacillus sakei]
MRGRFKKCRMSSVVSQRTCGRLLTINLNYLIHKWLGSPINQRQSARLAKDLKKRGFKFVGPVVTHLFMLAGGLIQLIDEK